MPFVDAGVAHCSPAHGYVHQTNAVLWVSANSAHLIPKRRLAKTSLRDHLDQGTTHATICDDAIVLTRAVFAPVFSLSKRINVYKFYSGEYDQHGE